MLKMLPRQAAVLLVAALSLAAADRRASFNENWKFLKGDAPGAEQPAFADSAWRSLNLPHDWAIEGPFEGQLLLRRVRWRHVPFHRVAQRA